MNVIRFPIERRQAVIWLTNRRTVGWYVANQYLHYMRDYYEAHDVEWDPDLFESEKVRQANALR